MDNEIHLKQFFIEKYGDKNMYYEYLAGRISIDKDMYDSWYKDVEARNRLFSYQIKKHNRIFLGDTIVESKLCENLCVSKFFVNKCCSHIGEFGKFKIEKKRVGISNAHYICNGIYLDTLNQIYDVLSHGAFTVGICAEKRSEFYNSVVDYYGKLRNFLLNNGYSTSALEINCNSKNRVYLMMYNAKSRSKVIK